MRVNWTENGGDVSVCSWEWLGKQLLLLVVLLLDPA